MFSVKFNFSMRKAAKWLEINVSRMNRSVLIESQLKIRQKPFVKWGRKLCHSVFHPNKFQLGLKQFKFASDNEAKFKTERIDIIQICFEEAHRNGYDFCIQTI